MRKWQVVFHIDEMEKWKLVLGNVENFLRDIGNDPYNAEIVVNGEAVLFLSEHYPEPVRLEQLSQSRYRSVCAEMHSVPIIFPAALFLPG